MVNLNFPHPVWSVSFQEFRMVQCVSNSRWCLNKNWRINPKIHRMFFEQFESSKTHRGHLTKAFEGGSKPMVILMDFPFSSVLFGVGNIMTPVKCHEKKRQGLYWKRIIKGNHYAIAIHFDSPWSSTWICLTLRIIGPSKLASFWGPKHPCNTGSNPSIGGSKWSLGKVIFYLLRWYIIIRPPFGSILFYFFPSILTKYQIQVTINSMVALIRDDFLKS